MVNPKSIHPQLFKLGAADKTAAKPLRFPLGLGERGVHEVCETSFGDMGALTGFVVAASHIRPGVVVWVTQYKCLREHGALMGQGQAYLRQELRPVLSVCASRRDDALWAIEEAVSSASVSLVIAEVSGLTFTASRRLQMASERSGVPVILVLPYTREGATAAAVRWRVQPISSAPNRYDSRALGAVRWHARIERSRFAPELSGQEFNLELDDETLSLRVASRLVAHPVTSRPVRAGEGDNAAFRETG